LNIIGSILELARWLDWIYMNILYPLIVEQNAIQKRIFKVLKEVSNCMRSNLVTRAHVGIMGIMVEEIQEKCSKIASIG
jgi:hypothetical protein